MFLVRLRYYNAKTNNICSIRWKTYKFYEMLTYHNNVVLIITNCILHVKFSTDDDLV